MKVKVVENHPYPWKEEEKKEGAKPDLRNKNKNNSGKKNNKSRKSDGSKKNKKRWY